MRRSERQRGFTLVESVMVIVITGILGAIVSIFIVAPVQAYLASAARANLVDQADTALRRVSRDLAIALPNSTRVTASGLSLELIPTSGAARYATEGAGKLDFGVDTSVDTTFDVVGPPLTLTTSQQLVFYNLGTDVPDANAYAPNGSAAEQQNSNRRVASNGAGAASTITFGSAANLPAGLQAPPYRVYAVGTPISYRCDLTPGVQTLTRYQGYGFQAVQPDPPVGGSSSILAKGVTSCAFSYTNAVVAARAALVTLRLTLGANTGSGDETVSLYHAIHVDNLP